MHSAQSSIITTAALLTVAVAAALAIYFWTQTLTTTTTTRSAPSLTIPPKIELAVPTYDPDTNTLTISLILRNLSPEPQHLDNYFVPLKDAKGSIIATATVSCDLPPSGICKTNAVYPNFQTSGTFRVGDSDQTITVSITVPRVVLSFISFSNNLFLSEPSDRYKNVLFTGDHNSATIYVFLQNISDVPASGTITASAPCFPHPFSVPYFLPAHQSKTYSIPVELNSPSSSCPITLSATYSASIASFSAPVYYLSFCDSNSTCYNALLSAQSRDANTVVMLAKDINVTTAPALDIPSGDYQNKVVFDGNGHLIETSKNPAIRFYYVVGFRVTDANIIAVYNGVVGAQYSKVQFERSFVRTLGTRTLAVNGSGYSIATIYRAELNFVNSAIYGQVNLYGSSEYSVSTLRFIRSEINSGTSSAIYSGVSYPSNEYTNMYIYDTNLITSTTPIRFSSSYAGTLETSSVLAIDPSDSTHYGRVYAFNDANDLADLDPNLPSAEIIFFDASNVSFDLQGIDLNAFGTPIYFFGDSNISFSNLHIYSSNYPFNVKSSSFHTDGNVYLTDPTTGETGAIYAIESATHTDQINPVVPTKLIYFSGSGYSVDLNGLEVNSWLSGAISVACSDCNISNFTIPERSVLSPLKIVAVNAILSNFSINVSTISAIYFSSAAGVTISDANIIAEHHVVTAVDSSVRFVRTVLEAYDTTTSYSYALDIYSSCGANSGQICSSDITFVESAIFGQIHFSNYSSIVTPTTIRFIRSEVNSSVKPALYFYTYLTYPERTNVYLLDANFITTAIPINFSSSYVGSFEVNLADANQWIYSPDTNDWYAPSDINVHIIDAKYPPQYFLLTDLNDVAGGGKVNVICDFNTALTPEECAALYVRKPTG
ncbi:MAG: hypothetical protein GXN93_00965 [Candidatus Diapherotrites archaeon]|nr:hypothetical protein [Candidatus Diapherotrites archaeon]